MGIWTIIPVKPHRRGKSRLAGVLTEQERTLINFIMLGHILRTVNKVASIEEVLVISRDPSVLATAHEYGARTVMEEKNRPALNMALIRATIVARTFGAHGVLVLPADLPLLTADDLQQVIELGSPTPSVVINPDRRNDGTNALLVQPAGIIDYAYGHGSFTKHSQFATERGIRLEVCRLPSLGLDLDLPEDLEALRSDGTLRMPSELQAQLQQKSSIHS